MVRIPAAILTLLLPFACAGCYLSASDRIIAMYQEDLDRIHADIGRFARGEPPQHHATLRQAQYERALLEAKIGREIQAAEEAERREEEQREREECERQRRLKRQERGK